MAKHKLLALVAACSLVTCSTLAPTSANAASSLKITNLSSLKKAVTVGKKVQIKTNISLTKISFKSSNKKIATVSKKGVIKACSKGTCTITLTTKINGKKVTKKFKVTIKNKTATATATATPTVTSTPEVVATVTPTTTSTPVATSVAETTTTPTQTVEASPSPTTEASPVASQTPSVEASQAPTVSTAPSITGTVFVTSVTFTDTGIQLADEAGNSVSSEDASNMYVTNGTTLVITSPTNDTSNSKNDKEITIKGSCKEGQIVVDVDKTTYKDGAVDLSLEGLTLSNSTAAPITVTSIDDKCTISVKKGTENSISTTWNDGQNTSSAILAKDDLKIKGKGTLTITNNAGYGIFCKNDLKIFNGTLIITSYNACLKGKDSVKIGDESDTSFSDLNLTLTSSYSDGIRSTNPIDDSTKASEDSDYADGKSGNVTINGGTIKITAYNDGIQSSDSLTINGGDFTIKTYEGMNYSGTTTTNTTTTTSDNQASNPSYGNPHGGGNQGGNWGGGMQEGNSAKTTTSCKAIKSEGNMIINKGTFQLDSSDDALHSGANLTINGGDLTLGSADDGIHADKTLTITGGNITISKSYEGLEALNIKVTGGTTHLVASDDGLNASDGSSNTSTQNPTSGIGGFPWGQGFTNTSSSTNATLEISGGYLYVNANGDGLDSNGSITISGGTTIVLGPTNNGNSSIDTDSGFTYSGGVVLAMDAGGMGNEGIPSTGSYKVFSGTIQNGTTIALTDASGNVLTYVTSPKSSSRIVYMNDSTDVSTTLAYTNATLTGSTDSYGYAEAGTIQGGTAMTEGSQTSQTPGGNFGGFPGMR